MNIEANEITAFIGPSGCGKTTFLKSINRMNDLIDTCHIEGKISIEGEDIYAVKSLEEFRKTCWYGLSKPNPFAMSIYDNVAFGPRAHGINKKAELDIIVESS